MTITKSWLPGRIPSEEMAVLILCVKLNQNDFQFTKIIASDFNL